MPQFAVGDRAVLFSAANGLQACPLVGWWQGLYGFLRRRAGRVHRGGSRRTDAGRISRRRAGRSPAVVGNGAACAAATRAGARRHGARSLAGAVVLGGGVRRLCSCWSRRSAWSPTSRTGCAGTPATFRCICASASARRPGTPLPSMPCARGTPRARASSSVGDGSRAAVCPAAARTSGTMSPSSRGSAICRWANSSRSPSRGTGVTAWWMAMSASAPTSRGTCTTGGFGGRSPCRRPRSPGRSRSGSGRRHERLRQRHPPLQQ